MAKVSDPAKPVIDARRQELIRLGREVNAMAGINGPPDMTIEELHESMRLRGVRPEDNIASSELMRVRYGDDWDKE
jgi:hypothetical protein